MKKVYISFVLVFILLLHGCGSFIYKNEIKTVLIHRDSVAGTYKFSDNSDFYNECIMQSVQEVLLKNGLKLAEKGAAKYEITVIVNPSKNFIDYESNKVSNKNDGIWVKKLLNNAEINNLAIKIQYYKNKSNKKDEAPLLAAYIKRFNNKTTDKFDTRGNISFVKCAIDSLFTLDYQKNQSLNKVNYEEYYYTCLTNKNN